MHLCPMVATDNSTITRGIAHEGANEAGRKSLVQVTRLIGQKSKGRMKHSSEKANSAWIDSSTHDALLLSALDMGFGRYLGRCGNCGN